MLCISNQLNPIMVEALKKSGKRKSGTVNICSCDFYMLPFRHMNNFKMKFLDNRFERHLIFRAVLVIIPIHHKPSPETLSLFLQDIL